MSKEPGAPPHSLMWLLCRGGRAVGGGGGVQALEALHAVVRGFRGEGRMASLSLARLCLYAAIYPISQHISKVLATLAPPVPPEWSGAAAPAAAAAGDAAAGAAVGLLPHSGSPLAGIHGIYVLRVICVVTMSLNHFYESSVFIEGMLAIHLVQIATFAYGSQVRTHARARAHSRHQEPEAHTRSPPARSHTHTHTHKHSAHSHALLHSPPRVSCRGLQGGS